MRWEGARPFWIGLMLIFSAGWLVPELTGKAQAQILPQGLLNEIGIEQKLGDPVPKDLIFKDSNGVEVRLGDYLGEKPVLLSFVYFECPMLCPMTLGGLLKSLRAINFDVGQEFEILTVSIAPEDTPAQAREKKDQYVADYGRPGAEQGWHFLTGEFESIQALTAAAGFRYAKDEETGQYAHASGIMILTPEGRLTRYLYGLEFSARDLRLALVEASKGRIGTPVDRILLYCYHYDPETGEYSLTIMNGLRVAGVATVAALVGFLFLALRRERHAVTPAPPVS